MVLPVWPAGIPNAPQRDTFRIPRPFNPPVATEFEAGNTRDRPRGTVQFRVVDMDIRMTPVQFALFDAFVTEDLAMGTKRFTMPVWNGSAMEAKTDSGIRVTARANSLAKMLRG